MNDFHYDRNAGSTQEGENLLENAFEHEQGVDVPLVVISDIQGDELEDGQNANKMPEAIADIHENALESEQDGDMHMPPVAVLDIPVDELEDRQNATVMPEDIPAVEEDALEHGETEGMLPVVIPYSS